MLPAWTDISVALHVHADAIDGGVRGQRADHHGDVVAPPAGIDDVGEQERLAVLLGDAAAELPAHQRMHLGVLVDRRIDAQQQPGLVETIEMVVQVGIAAITVHHPAPAARRAFDDDRGDQDFHRARREGAGRRLLIGEDVGARRRLDGFGRLGLEVRHHREQRLLLQALGFELDGFDPGAEQFGGVGLDQGRARP